MWKITKKRHFNTYIYGFVGVNYLALNQCDKAQKNIKVVGYTAFIDILLHLYKLIITDSFEDFIILKACICY